MQQSSTDVELQAATVEAVSDSFEWIRRQTALVAMTEAAAIQKAGGLAEAQVVVDGRRNRREEDVRLWGEITYVAGIGPVAEAVIIAHEFATMGAPRDSGFYAGNFLWLVNGEPRGSEPPDVRRMGVRGNVQLVNLAPYAPMIEIQVPDGVLWGAYNLLRRQYGTRLKLAYYYKRADAFPQVTSHPSRTFKYPMTVPVLEIANPAARGIAKVTRPGVNARRRAARAKRGRK